MITVIIMMIITISIRRIQVAVILYSNKSNSNSNNYCKVKTMNRSCDRLADWLTVARNHLRVSQNQGCIYKRYIEDTWRLYIRYI